MNEEADLSGGVRVLLAQADALISRGHEVTIITKGAAPTWIATNAEWEFTSDFEAVESDRFDFVVGTFWSTVAAAHRLAGERAVHLCQGYEGAFSFYAGQRGRIDAAYELPIPKLVVSRHLVDVCREFHDDVTFVGQVVDDRFFRQPPEEMSVVPRVLVAGAHQVDLKGIDDGYGAVLHARANGAQLHLVRVSPWAPSREEPSDVVADEFHVAVPAQEMVSLVHSCDLFVGPNHAEEGFGLPAAEAMASGIPCVLTRIPSYLSFDQERHDYALFGEEKNAISLGELLLDLASDEELRVRTAARGREVAEQFRSDKMADRLERFFLERHSS